MQIATPPLGIGIYTPAEAAFYSRVRTSTISRWIHGDARGEAVVHAQLAGDTDKTVTFNDFVQALAIRTIRLQYPEVSLQKIRNVVDEVRDSKGIEFPLATRHKAYVIKHGANEGELVLEIDRVMIQVSGRKKDQILLGPIAELYMDEITFDKDGNPEQYCAYSSRKGGHVIMNPHRRFGEPIIEDCGYSALTLWEASIAEGGLDAAALAYGVKREHVALACSYFDHLMNVAA